MLATSGLLKPIKQNFYGLCRHPERSLFMTHLQGGPGEAPGEIAPLPGWTPEPVREIIRCIEQSNSTLEHRAILERLALDPRMQKVWSELLKRDRSYDNFAYPATERLYPHLRSKNDLQSAALSETLHFAFRAARERMPVTRPYEILQNKELLLA